MLPWGHVTISSCLLVLLDVVVGGGTQRSFPSLFKLAQHSGIVCCVSAPRSCLVCEIALWMKFGSRTGLALLPARATPP